MLAHTCVGQVSTAKAMNMACQIVTNCTACTTYTVATTTGAAAWCRHAWLCNTASHTTLSLSVGARISVRHYVSKRKKKWNERNSMMMSNLLNTEWKKKEAAQQQGPLTHVNMLGGTEGSTRSSRYKCPAVAAQCRVVWIYVELRTQWRWPCQQEHLQGMHNALQKHWSTGIAKGLMKFKFAQLFCSLVHSVMNAFQWRKSRIRNTLVLQRHLTRSQFMPQHGRQFTQAYVQDMGAFWNIIQPNPDIFNWKEIAK